MVKSWSKDFKNCFITAKYSDTLWYSKSKTKETRQYHWFDIGYLVYKQGRQVGVKLCIGKLLVFVGWQPRRKTNGKRAHTSNA